MKRLQAPGASFQYLIVRRIADLDNALHLARCLFDTSPREEKVPEVAACEQFAFDALRRRETVRRLAKQAFRPAGILRPVDMAIRQRQPEVGRMRANQRLEYARRVLPRGPVESDLIEAVGRVVVVRLLCESLPA